MAGLPWPSADLDALGADSFLDRTTKKIEDTLAPLRRQQREASAAASAPVAQPAPVAAPDISFDLKDWSPWRAQDENRDTKPRQDAAPSAPSSFDDVGWFPWRDKAKPAEMPHGQSGTADATMVDGRSGPQNTVAPGEPIRSITMSQGGPTQAYDPSAGVEQWNPLVQEAAQAYGVDPADLKGLMHIESGGNPKATSSVGAASLMQVMPFHFQPGEDPYDPRTNIMRGAKVYADALHRYGGDRNKAAAAYFGAIDGDGNITGASDGNTDGYGYVRQFNAARARYQGAPTAGAASPSAPAASQAPAAAVASSPAPSAAGAPRGEITIRHKGTGAVSTVNPSQWPYMTNKDEFDIIDGPPTMQKTGADLPEDGPSAGDQKRARLAAAAQGDTMLRQPLGAATGGPDSTTGQEYDPRDADNGPHESGYTDPGDGAGSVVGSTPAGGYAAPVTQLAETPGAVTPASDPPQPDYQFANGGDPTPSAQFTEMPVKPYTGSSGGPGSDARSTPFGDDVNASDAYAPPAPAAFSSPDYQIQDGRVVPPTPAGDWQPLPQQPSMLPVWDASGNKVGYRQEVDDTSPPSDPTVSDQNYTGQPSGRHYDPADPSTGVNPSAPGALRPTDLPSDSQGARPWLPATTPAGGIQSPPGLVDSLVPRAAQTGPLSDEPTAPSRWSPQFQNAYANPSYEQAPYQDDQREPATGYRPAPRVLSPYHPGSANALADVETPSAAPSYAAGAPAGIRPTDAQVGAQTADSYGSAVPGVVAPAARVFGQAAGEVNAQEDEAHRRNAEVITSDIGRLGIAPVETIRRGVRLATAFVQAAPQATVDEVDAALRAAGFGKDTYGVDSPFGRVGIADAVVGFLPGKFAGAIMSGGVGHIPGMGATTAYGTGVAGAIERGASAVVAAGKRAAPVVGDAIEAGGHRALDAMESAGARAGEAWRGGRQVAATANAVDDGARMRVAVGPVPSGEARIPGAGYTSDLRPGAEAAIRQDVARNAVDEPMRRADVARKAREIIGLDPERARAWQDEALARDESAPVVRSEALRQARVIDAEHADRAIENLRAAQERARTAGSVQNMTGDDKLDAAAALLEAADAARAMQRSGAADTAEGRAAARILNQRKNSVVASQAFEAAARARQVGQDAAFAAREAQQAARTGRVTPQGEQRLRTLRDKLLEAERHGLVGDGANGRLDAMQQPASSTVAAATVGPTRAARPGTPLGTRIATDAGNSALGSVVGATTGYAAPAPDEETRRKNAAGAALIGAVGFPIIGRTMRGRGGALASLGPVGAPESLPRRVPGETWSFGSTPKTRYQYRVRVVPMDELITSHTNALTENPAFPKELQPRARERAASRIQIDKIVSTFDPEQYVVDSHRLDSGPAIIGPDNVVESGNGRTIALRRVAEEHPEAYAEYVAHLKSSLGNYGLPANAADGIDRPVLVRERLSDVDRAAFTAEANGRASAGMGPLEQAAQDSGRISDTAISRLQVGDDQSIDEALLHPGNGGFVRSFMATIPDEERGLLLDARGDLNTDGLKRVKSALLVKTYGGDAAGARLAASMIESAKPDVRNVQNGIFGSLPSVSRAESLIASGQRDAGLSIADDVSKAVDVYTRLRQARISVADYVAQAAMFGDRETTPLQDRLLGFFNDNARSSRRIRALLDEYAGTVEGMKPPEELGGMFGEAAPVASKDEVLDGALRRLGTDKSADVGGAGADGAGLAGPGKRRISVPEYAPDAQAGGSSLADQVSAAETLTPDQRIAQLQAENDRLRSAAVGGTTAPRPSRAPAATSEPLPTTPQRPGAVPRDLIPSTGGPEGSLSVEGAPAPVAPVRRPGPVGSLPAGGPEGTLAVEGAPQPVRRPGAVPEGMAPRGGPEGALQQEGAPTRLAAPTAAERGALPAGGPEGALSPTLTNEQRADDRLLRDAEGRNQRFNDRALRDAEDRNATAADRLMRDVEGRNATAERQAARQAETDRLKGVAAQIDHVLANPNGPGSVERLQQLHADLTAISQQGFERSSQIRQRLQRSGLLRAGLASKDQNVDGLVQALANTDPDHPEQMQAVLKILSKPRLIDRILEYQYVNMLASPITQGVNITANAMQMGGRLFFQNPLEYAYSGGKSTGVGAAFQGAARGFKDALPDVKQIMKTGTSSDAVERATETGNYSQVGRELLTEQFGKVGALLHVISTRPLQAMDALFGQMAYASAAEQYAQRTADRLLSNGSASVKGMSREAARQHVMSNIWDHPDVIEKAGKIQDYTLLKSNDSSDKGFGILERQLRQMASLGHAPEGANFERQVLAFGVNNVLPFFNVPLNSAKQGLERTVGVPVNAVRAARAYARGDVQGGAELAAKATIGAAAVTTAGILAAGDNLTGEGPGGTQQAIWEQDHRRNSWRVPGTQTWFSWEGTPLAIPFGMAAGVKQGWSEAGDKADKAGQTSTLDRYGTAALKGGQGAVQGFTSQSFIRAMGDQYQLLTGQQTGLGTVANQATSNVSRFVPASGMLNFLANVSDTMVRDPGKPQSFSDLPENIGAREAMRIPGAREQVDTRLTPYGQPTRNEQYGPAGALPYYRGAGVGANDPINQRLEAAHASPPSSPADISVPGVPGSKIALSVPERHTFQEYAGQEYRKRLEQVMTGGRYDALPPAGQQKMLDDIAQAAHDAASAKMRQDIGPAELRRRDSAAQQRQPAGVR